ncbi:MAG: RluA family pseudouridine synthase [Clostridia bacterium]|nr:RluA family pseudouridine synthase [Clostridia bacterium]
MNVLLQEEDCLHAVADQKGERLDVFCARASGETRSRMQGVLSDGGVTVNGKVAKANCKLNVGDAVCICVPQPVAMEVEAENIPLTIVYEDSDIAVIDKPQGMVVHPAPGSESGTLVNALLFHLTDLSGVGGVLRPGIVHRIDKMTSGLIVVAKNDQAHNALAAQMKTHAAGRTYVTIVEQNIREDEGTVNAPIGRHPKDRKKMAIVPDGREAITHWRTLARFGEFTLVRANLETGRTHQIRVHMASLHHPVAGDTVYGAQKPKLGLEGQALHACRLRLAHPRTGESMTFRAPLPGYFKRALIKAGCDVPAAEMDAWLDRLLDEERDE